MSLQVFKEIRAAVANLDPAEVQAAADRPLRIGLLAASERGFAAMKEFLLPSEKVSERKRAEGAALLDRALGSEPPDHFDVVLCEQGLPCPRNGYTFFAGQPEETVCEVLAAHDELALALARNFPPFRQPVVDRVHHDRRVRMAGAGARTGRQDPVRWRPHPKGRHRICRNLCRGSRPGSASPPGLRAIERRAPGLVSGGF